MWLYPPGSQDVPYLPALGDQGVGDELPVASPGDGLGTEDGNRGRSRQGHQFRQCGLKLGGLHVVGVGIEGLAPPSRVG